MHALAESTVQHGADQGGLPPPTINLVVNADAGYAYIDAPIPRFGEEGYVMSAMRQMLAHAEARGWTLMDDDEDGVEIMEDDTMRTWLVRA